ncbi:MAG TPA: disulfide bond formation protein B [Lamprocystis sp. (in: g-proteobacteria)]|nr:disulfide bond formation protein B [Lamprocystis sp. (in: g-proteobacteria)]
MPRIAPRPLWIVLALLCAAVVLASFALTVWLNLNPCYLCIFQRTLFMLLCLLAVLTAIGERWVQRLVWVPGGLFLLGALTGGGAAAYQSWLQLQPPGSISCVGGHPGLIERLVEWLGQQAPTLFMATGFCEDAALVILGLSLANWALLVFAGCLAIGSWALWLGRRARH